jgi:putative glycosyltransferase (TIGR04372 family)
MPLFKIPLVKRYIDALPMNISSRIIRPIYRLTKNIVSLCISIVYTFFAVLLWIFKIKFPDFFIERIGHLTSEPDCFIKDHLLKIGALSPSIMLAPRGKVANQALVRYWSKYLVVIQNPVAVYLLKPFQKHPLTKFSTSKYVVATHHTADIFRINNFWGARPPLLKLKCFDIKRGTAALKLMGIPEGAWYVCLHAREGQYSPADEYMHSYRNLSIADFEKAVSYIVLNGGVCIRMGDATMSPAPKMPGLIDYALSDFKRDWMDLFLAANCTFFLGSNSGAYAMSSLFGVPSAIVNMAPLSAAPTFGKNDISIPMLYKSDESDMIMDLKYVMQSKSATFRLTEEFQEARISLVKNTPEDILDLTIEQLDRIRGTYIFSADNEIRQEKFKALFKSGHYSLGASSRIGDVFLRKYQHLL